MRPASRNHGGGRKPPPPPPAVLLRAAAARRAQQLQRQQQLQGRRTGAHPPGGGKPPPPPPGGAPPGFVWSEEERERIRRRSYLGPRGFTVWADALATEPLRAAVRALASFQPLAVGGGPGPARPPPPLRLAVEGAAKWFLPSAQALAWFGVPDRAQLAYPDRPPAELLALPPPRFTLSLMEKQVPIVGTCLAALREQRARQRFAGVVVQASCGIGKTIMGIYLGVAGIPSIAAGLVREDAGPAAPLTAAELARLATAPPPAGAVLVLVNKTLLMQQWQNRIQQACPGARVGRIQGPHHEVAGCHFVICMIQTLWSKSYPPDAFAAFQTVIVDEAHSVCAEKYFQSLRQVVAPFMIALSATLEKSNGTEEILARYIGPVVYKSPLEPTKYLVTVRIVQYACHEDPEYSRLDYDRYGKLDYTATIGRVFMYPPRIDAVVETVLRTVAEFPDMQILLLSARREPLSEIAKRLDARESGVEHRFYLGGMKQAALDESSAAHLILATFSMAAEALDIPTLDCVFFYNSKPTVTQPLGRPMRIMNNRKLVLDFVDAHQVFQGQLFKKRLPLYRSSGYHVYKCGYHDLGKWRPVYLPPGFQPCGDAAERSGGSSSSSSSSCGGGGGGGRNDDAAVGWGDDDDGGEEEEEEEEEEGSGGDDGGNDRKRRRMDEEEEDGGTQNKRRR